MTVVTAFGTSTQINSRSLNNAFDAVLNNGYNFSTIVCTGTITAGTFSGSGASLTALNASNLSSGTVPTARISGSYTGITGIGTLTVGSIPVALVTGLAASATTDTTNASNITSGTLANARLPAAATNITSLGTLTALTVDGPSSAAFTLGDWTTTATYGGIIGNAGYLLVGNTASDTIMYLRTSSAGTVNIGANGANTITVGDGSTTGTSVTGLLTTGNIWNTSQATTTLTGYQYVVRSTSGFPAYYYFTSMREGKRNIQTITDSASLIDQLHPVTYQAKITDDDDELSASWKNNDLEYGFIAEEVAEVGTGFLAQYRDNGNGGLEPAGWKFHGVVSVLVAEMQSVRKRLADLEAA
jgi:hypothetical protein